MDVLTYVLCKKIAAGAVSGISGIELNGTTVTFTTTDGTKYDIVFPTPADGISVVNMDIDDNGHLICELSDGTSIDAGTVPTVKGEDGYTPVKGKDYFTEEDIQEILGRLSTDLEDYQTKENLYLGADGVGTPEVPAEGTVLYAVKSSLEADFISQEVLKDYPTNQEFEAFKAEMEKSSELEII